MSLSLLPPHSVQSLDNKSQGSDHPRQTFIPASPFRGLAQLFWFLNKMLPSFTSNTYLSGQPLKGMKQKPCPARNSCSWQKWKAKILPQRSNLTDTTQIMLNWERKARLISSWNYRRKLFQVPFTKNCNILVFYHSRLELIGFSLLIISFITEKICFQLAKQLFPD